MSHVFLQIKRQNKVLVLIHNTKATACVNLRAINLIWDEFVLLNCHSFQLIGKIMIYKKIKHIPEWIFFSINKTIFLFNLVILFQSSSPFHISLPWINTKEISCWISLPSHHTVISVKNKKRSWSLPWWSVITHLVEHWPTKQNSTKIPHQATDTRKRFFASVTRAHTSTRDIRAWCAECPKLKLQGWRTLNTLKMKAFL